MDILAAWVLGHDFFEQLLRGHSVVIVELVRYVALYPHLKKSTYGRYLGAWELLRSGEE